MREEPFDDPKPDKPEGLMKRKATEVLIWAAVVIPTILVSYYLWTVFIRHACEV